MSSAEEDSADASGEEEEEDADEGEEEGSDEEPEPPKLELPDRATRGRRMGKLLEEEDSADEEFWGQEFFQEEKQDEEYTSESSVESVADSDFSASEASSDEEGEEVDDRPRRKALKPPGAAVAVAAKKTQQQQRQQQQLQQQERPTPMEATAHQLEQPVTPVLAAAAVADAEGTPSSPTSPTTRAAVRQAAAEVAAEAAAAPVQAPTLRKSTRERIEVAEKERARIEQKRPRKQQAKAEHRPLTQEELLAEAAETELANTASVRALMAAEEEVRARAAVRRGAYSGPLLRYHSLRVGGESVMLFEIANMLPPPELQPQKAPAPPAKPLCVITGRPARYRDPETGMPYADIGAFRELRRRAAEGRPLNPKRAKRKRFGTGAWAHAASALREDLPASPEEQPAPPDVVPGRAPCQAQAGLQGVQDAAGFPAAPMQLSGPSPQTLAALVNPALPHSTQQQLGASQAQQPQHRPAAPQLQHAQPSAGLSMRQGHVQLHGAASSAPAQSAGLALPGALPGQLPALTSQAPPAGDLPAMHPPPSANIPAAALGASGVQQAASAVELPGEHPGSLSALGLT